MSRPATRPATRTWACQVFCRRTSSDAARILDEAEVDLPADGVEPAYEIWRRRTQAEFAA